MSLITFCISFLSGRGSLNVFMTFSLNATWQHGIKLANPNTLLNQILVTVSKCEVLKRTMSVKKNYRGASFLFKRVLTLACSSLHEWFLCLHTHALGLSNTHNLDDHALSSDWDRKKKVFERNQQQHNTSFWIELTFWRTAPHCESLLNFWFSHKIKLWPQYVSFL